MTKTAWITIVLLLLVGGASFWYWSQKKSEEPTGAVGTAKTVSEWGPEIQTNI